MKLALVLAPCVLFLAVGCSSTRYVAVELEFRDAQSLEPMRDTRLALKWRRGLGLYTANPPPNIAMHAWGRTDADGRVVFPVLAEGTWDLEADIPGYDLQSHFLMLHTPEGDEAFWQAPWQTCRIERQFPFQPDRLVAYRIVSVMVTDPSRRFDPPLREE